MSWPPRTSLGPIHSKRIAKVVKKGRPKSRHFPPPWTVEEANDACFIVRDANDQALGYFYFEDDPGRVLRRSC